MNRPWMPLYIADYLRDTSHLCALESGAYLHLIMAYWVAGKLPDNDRQLATIAKVTLRQWHQIKQTIQAFFYDGWKHRRINEELKKVSEVSAKRRASALQRHCKTSANAGANAGAIGHTLHTSHITIEEKKESIGRSTTRPMSSIEFDEFWKIYPRRLGANPKAPASKVFHAAVRQGTDPAAIIGGARHCAATERDKIGTPYIPQAVKWLRDRRWEDYAAPPRASPQVPIGAPTDEELRKKYGQPAIPTETKATDAHGDRADNGPELQREGAEIRGGLRSF